MRNLKTAISIPENIFLQADETQKCWVGTIICGSEDYRGDGPGDCGAGGEVLSEVV
jgi:hypothetical protein